VAQDTQPGLLARIGRGMLDLGQGVNQGVLNVEDAIGGPRTPQTVYNPQTQQQDAVTNTIDPIAQDYTAQVNQERAQYDQSRAAAGEVGPDWARMFGTVAAAAPSVLVAPQVSGPAWLARGVPAGCGWRRRSDRVLTDQQRTRTWQKCARRSRDGRDGGTGGRSGRRSSRQSVSLGGGSGRGSRRGCTTLYGR